MTTYKRSTAKVQHELNAMSQDVEKVKQDAAEFERWKHGQWIDAVTSAEHASRYHRYRIAE